MEDIMLIRSSFLRRIISQVINKTLKKQLPGTEVQLGEVQANWSEKEQMYLFFDGYRRCWPAGKAKHVHSNRGNRYAYI